MHAPSIPISPAVWTRPPLAHQMQMFTLSYGAGVKVQPLAALMRMACMRQCSELKK